MGEGRYAFRRDGETLPGAALPLRLCSAAFLLMLLTSARLMTC